MLAPFDIRILALGIFRSAIRKSLPHSFQGLDIMMIEEIIAFPLTTGQN